MYTVILSRVFYSINYFFFVFQRAQPEIVTFLGYESDNALYTIPGDHLILFLGITCLHFIFWHETVKCTKLLSFS